MSRVTIILLSTILLSCFSKDEKVIDTWDNNEVKAKKVYYNDRDTGQYILLTYYIGGQLESKAHFTVDIKNGWSVTYYDNGNVKDSVFFRNDIPVTTTYKFHPNGVLAHTGQLNDFGKKDSWWIFYDSLGRLKEKTEFVDGDMKTKTYYFDTLGWMIKEIIFKEGTIGEIHEKKNYKDSVLHGSYRKYHDTGNLAKAGEFLNGKRENTSWTDFYSNGAKFREYTFTGENDWNVRVANLWDTDGNLIIKNGNGKYVTYDYCSNGKIRTKIVTHYKQGYPTKTDKTRVSACR